MGLETKQTGEQKESGSTNVGPQKTREQIIAEGDKKYLVETNVANQETMQNPENELSEEEKKQVLDIINSLDPKLFSRASEKVKLAFLDYFFDRSKRSRAQIEKDIDTLYMGPRDSSLVISVLRRVGYGPGKFEVGGKD